MSTRQLSISDFAAHCADELASVESGSSVVELTRAGKVVAVIYPAPQPIGHAGTLADWVGTGVGYTLAPGSTLEDPAFEPNEWEEAPEGES